jgi:hypothetical protein
MTDTAQPSGAAETEVVSKSDAIAAAADAFKVSLGQIEQPTRELPPRAEDGRFTSVQAGEEIEAEAEPVEGEEAAESQDEDEEQQEAAEEAQPEAAPLPTSWPAEHAETWRTLPPEAQAIIAEREGQRDAAVNAKFQEAANLRKAHEAEVNEAQSSRQRYAEAVDTVLSLVVPQMPPRSMLDYNSSDYDPDKYHHDKALYEDTVAFLRQHATQRQQIAAQEEQQRFSALNSATKDAFIRDVPDVTDQAKAPAVLQELMEYAVSLGTPAEVFQTPTTALEWHVLWKAREYDRLQKAKARVAEAPKPEPRKAQPAVKPGVTTPKSAIEQQRRGKALDRLRREGSIDAGAAALKQLMKGL